MTHINANLIENTTGKRLVSSLVPHILPSVALYQKASNRILLIIQTRIYREESATRLESLQGESHHFQCDRIIKVMQHTKRKDDLKRRQLSQVFKSQLLAVKHSQQAKSSARLLDIRLTDIETPIVNIR